MLLLWLYLAGVVITFYMWAKLTDIDAGLVIFFALIWPLSVVVFIPAVIGNDIVSRTNDLVNKIRSK